MTSGSDPREFPECDVLVAILEEDETRARTLLLDWQLHEWRTFLTELGKLVALVDELVDEETRETFDAVQDAPDDLDRDEEPFEPPFEPPTELYPSWTGLDARHRSAAPMPMTETPWYGDQHITRASGGGRIMRWRVAGGVCDGAEYCHAELIVEKDDERDGAFHHTWLNLHLTRDELTEMISELQTALSAGDGTLSLGLPLLKAGPA